jgi:hypothetical protein
MQLGDQRGWSDADIAAMIDVALVRRGVQAGPKLEDLSSIEQYFLARRQKNSWLNSQHQLPGYGSGSAGPNRQSPGPPDPLPQ